MKGIGIVLSGTVKHGEIRIGDKLLLGPKDGGFLDVTVKSIHNNFREDISMLIAGTSGCINIKSTLSSRKDLVNERHIKKGMVMLQHNFQNNNKNPASRVFKA